MSGFVFHNTVQPFVATSIGASATDSTTCPWIDTEGWVERKVSVDATVADGSGSIDIDIDMLVSSKGAYELNNEATVDTEDYKVINVVTALTSGVYTSYDADDIDDLQRPVRSTRFTIDNDDASDAVLVNLWFEGQS